MIEQDYSLVGEFIGLIWVAVGLALLTMLLWLVQRGMDHPRLPVIDEEGRAPRATRPGVLRYVLTTIPLMAFWYATMLLLLLIATRDRTALEISVAVLALVGGTRLLAHIHHGSAEELAKVVPLVLVGVVLIGGDVADQHQWERSIDEFSDLLGMVGSDIVALILFDFVVTAGWFAARRALWRRRARRVERGGPQTGVWRRIWRRWRKIGYT